MVARTKLWLRIARGRSAKVGVNMNKLFPVMGGRLFLYHLLFCRHHWLSICTRSATVHQFVQSSHFICVVTGVGKQGNLPELPEAPQVKSLVCSVLWSDLPRKFMLVDVQFYERIKEQTRSRHFK